MGATQPQTAGASGLEADMSDAGKPGDNNAGDDSSHPGTTTAWISEPPQPDILQRIAAALLRTDEAKPTGGKDVSWLPDMVPLGKMPPHLRHVHNLVGEVTEEAEVLHRALMKKLAEAQHVRDLMFSALEQQLPAPKDAKGVQIHEDWTITARVPQDDDPDLGSMFGGRDDPFGPQVFDLGKMFGDRDGGPEGLGDILSMMAGGRRGRRRRPGSDD